MSWCAGCLGVQLIDFLTLWGPLQRGDILWVQSLLIDFWLLVDEISTLSLILLTTQTMVTTGILPHKENPHGRAGNRTRDLVISSQKLRPLDHEAGHYLYMQISLRRSITLSVDTSSLWKNLPIYTSVYSYPMPSLTHLTSCVRTISTLHFANFHAYPLKKTDL